MIGLNALVAILPLAFGASLYFIVRRIMSVKHDVAAFVICGYIGLLSVNGLAAVATYVGIVIDGFDLISVFILGTAALWGMELNVRRRFLGPYVSPRLLGSSGTAQTWTSRAMVVIGAALSLLYLAFSLFIVSLAPISAWDVLGAWSFQATQFIEQGLVSGTITNYGSGNHPATATSYLGWSAWAASLGRADHGGLLNWLLAALMLSMAIAQILRDTFGRSVYLLCPLFVLCAPLLENHVGLAGYSEIWLTLVATCAVILIAESVETGNSGTLLFGISCAALVIFTRKTGIANLVCILLALLCAKTLFHLSPLKRILLLGSLIGAITILIVFGFSTTILGRDLIWTPADMTLQFAGRTISIALYPIDAVIKNEIVSKFSNLSFGIYFIAIIASSLSLLMEGYKSSLSGRHKTAAAALFLVLNFYGYWAVLFLSQLLSADGFSAAIPGNDTGNSRFSLPLVGSGLVIISWALRLISVPHHQRTRHSNRDIEGPVLLDTKNENNEQWHDD